MNTLENILELVTHGCFMTSIDLQDAYYVIPIVEEHRKYLRFEWEGRLYQFCCLPFWVRICTQNFYKNTQGALSVLRNLGHQSAAYIDDVWLVGISYQETLCNTTETISKLTGLGFVINTEKSTLVPTKKIEHLGFVIDSENMLLSLTYIKSKKLEIMCNSCLQQSGNITLQFLSHVIGTLESYSVTVEYGKVLCKQLLIEKNWGLKMSKGKCSHHYSIT